MTILTEHSTESIQSQVARELRAQILTGTLEEGVAMPPRVLARRHRVSATSVERAFASLAAEGLGTVGHDGCFAVAALGEDQRRDLDRERQLEVLRQEALSAQELRIARDIQCRLLPPPRVDGDGWTVIARNEPARFVAGDFYDVLRHGDGTVDLVVADVAGKGIGPSLIMASVKAVLPFVTSGRPVVEAMAELNRRLCRELGKREFIALALARFTPATGRLELANAGMPDPYRLRRPGRSASSEVETLEVRGERLPLGLRPGLEYGSTVTILEPGDRLLLLSDGLPEAETATGEPMGYERLASHLATAPRDRATIGDSESWLDDCLRRLRRATTVAQTDDWTAMLLERRR